MEEEVLEYFNTTQKGIVNNDHIFQIILYGFACFLFVIIKKSRMISLALALSP